VKAINFFKKHGRSTINRIIEERDKRKADEYLRTRD